MNFIMEIGVLVCVLFGDSLPLATATRLHLLLPSLVFIVGLLEVHQNNTIGQHIFLCLESTLAYLVHTIKAVLWANKWPGTLDLDLLVCPHIKTGTYTFMLRRLGISDSPGRHNPGTACQPGPEKSALSKLRHIFKGGKLLVAQLH